MTYDARQIANWFIDRAAQDGRSLSIMSLLKLSYIAHGWRLEMENRPLFENRIEAWRYGPVIPDVYSSLRPKGITPQSIDSDFSLPEDVADQAFLEQIYNIYGLMSPFRLSELTHVSGGPWETAMNLGGSYTEIPNVVMRSHYVIKRLSAEQTNV